MKSLKIFHIQFIFEIPGEMPTVIFMPTDNPDYRYAYEINSFYRENEAGFTNFRPSQATAKRFLKSYLLNPLREM